MIGDADESMAAAGTEQSLDAGVERPPQERDIAERKRRIREILESLGPVPAGVTSDHSDLYDEWGLPK
jgi:antitoxin VapB